MINLSLTPILTHLLAWSSPTSPFISGLADRVTELAGSYLENSVETFSRLLINKWEIALFAGATFTLLAITRIYFDQKPFAPSEQKAFVPKPKIEVTESPPPEDEDLDSNEGFFTPPEVSSPPPEREIVQPVPIPITPLTPIRIFPSQEPATPKSFAAALNLAFQPHPFSVDSKEGIATFS